MMSLFKVVFVYIVGKFSSFDLRRFVCMDVIFVAFKVVFLFEDVVVFRVYEWVFIGVCSVVIC